MSQENPPISNQGIHLADLVSLIDQLGEETGEIKGRPRPFGLYVYKETARGMARDRDNLVLKILKERRSQVEVGLQRHPGEDFHHYSQNRVVIDPRRAVRNARPIHTSLDLLASAEGSMDSEIALSIVGKPEFYIEESAKSFLIRTYEEIRSTERVFSIARKRRDALRMAESDTIKKQLVKRLLVNLRTNNKAGPTMHVILNEANKIQIDAHLGGETRSTKIVPDGEIMGWVIATGGLDRTEGNPAALQSRPRLIV